jgi:hypothetical protein
MGFETRWRPDPIIGVEGEQGFYWELFEKSSVFQVKGLTFGNYGQMESGLKIFSQKLGLDPMRWQPSGKLGKDMGYYPQFQGIVRVTVYGAIREMVGRSWYALKEAGAIVLKGPIRQVCFREPRGRWGCECCNRYRRGNGLHDRLIW